MYVALCLVTLFPIWSSLRTFYNNISNPTSIPSLINYKLFLVYHATLNKYSNFNETISVPLWTNSRTNVATSCQLKKYHPLRDARKCHARYRGETRHFRAPAFVNFQVTTIGGVIRHVRSAFVEKRREKRFHGGSIRPLFRIDIIGMKLNPRHVEYLTSRRFERLSINQQKRSAVLIDNSKAGCTERERERGEGRGGRERDTKRVDRSAGGRAGFECLVLTALWVPPLIIHYTRIVNPPRASVLFLPLARRAAEKLQKRAPFGRTEEVSERQMLATLKHLCHFPASTLQLSFTPFLIDGQPSPFADSSGDD